MPLVDLATLRQKMMRLQEVGRHGDEVVSCGLGPLDERLPGGGLRRGSLAEWIAAGDGAGATSLALLAARIACCDGGSLVVLDDRREFCPPAAVRLGIRLEQLIVIHAQGEADRLWALDQALRCRGVAAVLAWPEKLDGRVFRRLQLAAEEGGGLGLFLRPDAAKYTPSWADVRFFVEPLPYVSAQNVRRLRIYLLRCRGGAEGRSVDVDLDDDPDSMAVANGFFEKHRILHRAPA